MFLYRSCSIKNKEKISKILRKRVQSFYSLNFSEKMFKTCTGSLRLKLIIKFGGHLTINICRFVKVEFSKLRLY